MMRLLKAFFITVLLGMLAVTLWASLHENVGVGLLKVLREPWAAATLADAYCGFLTFFLWVCYKEGCVFNRLGWFVAILIFGNIAMASYALIELWRLPPGAGPAEFLARRKDACAPS